MVSASPKAWLAIDRSKTSSYYFDLRRAKCFYDEKRLTPYTSPTTILYGMQEALRIIQEEGFENVLARYKLVTKALRAGIKALGLEPFVSDERASNTVTAVKVPDGIDSVAMRNTMNRKYHVYVAGGLGEIMKTTFRIGHLGYIGRGDILNGISALELALSEQGYKVNAGQGVAATQRVFAKTHKPHIDDWYVKDNASAVG
jgi:aspartate aminotransferase-like enzyme